MRNRNATEPPVWESEVDSPIVEQANWIASWLAPQTGITVCDGEGRTIGANVVTSELLGIPWNLFMGATPLTRELPVVGEDGQLMPNPLHQPMPTLATGLAQFSELFGIPMPAPASGSESNSDSPSGPRIRWFCLSSFPLKMPSTDEVLGALCAFTREPNGERLRRAKVAVLDTYHELVDGGRA